VDVSVIIISYNKLPVIISCLESLERIGSRDDTEIIVVDNASSDGTPAAIRERFPRVNLIASRENLGYSRGVNLGIRQARGGYFLILNPDTIVREDSIETLRQFMDRHPEAGIVGPKLVFNDGNVQYSCRKFYTWKVLLLRRTFLGRLFKNSRVLSDHLMLDFDHETTREVDWIIGACMLARRSAVESVGLMDERFFLYFEDVDWCYRMKQKGWKVYYHPDSVIVHDYARESAQSVINRSVLMHLASMIRYYEKWNFVMYFLKKYREVSKIILFLLVDLIAFNLAFLSAYYLRVIMRDILTNPIFPIVAYQRFVVFENLLFVFTYFAAGLYRIRRETTHIDELFHIGKAIVLASILLMASTYISHIRTYSRMVVAFLVPLATLYDWGFRTAVRRFHRLLLAQKIDLKRVCIVGPHDEAQEFELRLLKDRSLGIEVVGFIDARAENLGTAEAGLGDLGDLESIVDEYRIQEVIILPNSLDADQIAGVVTMGRRRILDVAVLTDYSGLVTHQATVADLAGLPIIAYRRDTRYPLNRLAKRLFDIVLGTIFIIASVLPYVVYCIYAYIRSGRPFSGETRLGFRERPFTLPVAGTGISNRPSDLVNLPLFWLVVIGKMSIVGPYPFPVSKAGMLDRTAHFRFDVRPGITGYWRVGSVEDVVLEDLLVQDANYTRNWSFVQDMKILLRTIGFILTGRKHTLTFRTPIDK
jgi:GT2 family glycosyltransferase/lipopolysaccharide/colanic/teichoic acid biosynthesis glycosyltransferase